MMHKINHLYWRAGFGLNPEEWKEKQNWPIKKAISELFERAENPEELQIEAPQAIGDFRKLSDEEKKALAQKGRESLRDQINEWINRMASSEESPLLERMSLFWHGHFACRSRSGRMAAQQLNAIRKHALGNFRDLVLAIAQNPAMIRYLNNQQNKKLKPNENFARELMELFTIGRGNYTEKDIKEAARAFTGWSSTMRGEFIFRRGQHDFDEKSFFGQSGNFNGEDIIDLILEQKETATFITRKIYRYFVNAIPDESIIEGLANQFYNSDYDIKDLMYTIFSSDWFYELSNMGTKIKSPVELIAGMKRGLNIGFQNPQAVIGILRSLGQLPFNPPNVAGWPGGRAWIDNSTLMLRLNIPMGVANSKDVQFRPKDDLTAQQRGGRIRKMDAVVDFNPIEDWTSNYTEEDTYSALEQWLFLSQPQFSKNDLDSVTRNIQNFSYVQATTFLLMSLPEYQMC